MYFIACVGLQSSVCLASSTLIYDYLSHGLLADYDKKDSVERACLSLRIEGTIYHFLPQNMFLCHGLCKVGNKGFIDIIIDAFAMLKCSTV